MKTTMRRGSSIYFNQRIIKGNLLLVVPLFLFPLHVSFFKYLQTGVLVFSIKTTIKVDLCKTYLETVLQTTKTVLQFRCLNI
ncbi:hypothetical protein HanIR_Chr10g0501561 [Helianthus annuus]|nr:hypothetical protein HanIR_Chr10g0501561 [Helianthus annuus]